MSETLPQIAIIGAGHIGRLLAKRLVLEDGLPVILFNRAGSSSEAAIREEVEAVNAQARTHGTDAWITLSFNLADIKQCRVIHYVAGAARQAGEERSALMTKNAHIVDQFIPPILAANPNAMIINAANPLDMLTRYIYECTRKHGAENRVIGMGSSLDTRRFLEITEQYLSAMGNDFADTMVEGAYVIGEHGPTMTPIFSKATIQGKPFTEIFNEKQIAEITERTRNRGAEIIQETEHSDVAGPAGRLRDMTLVVTRGEEHLIPCCLRLESGVFMGVMGNFYKGKVKPVLLDISPKELQGVHKSLEKLAAEWEGFRNA
jgi:malate dehydrogenase